MKIPWLWPKRDETTVNILKVGGFFGLFSVFDHSPPPFLYRDRTLSSFPSWRDSNSCPFFPPRASSPWPFSLQRDSNSCPFAPREPQALSSFPSRGTRTHDPFRTPERVEPWPFLSRSRTHGPFPNPYNGKCLGSTTLRKEECNVRRDGYWGHWGGVGGSSHPS